jgi:hypothetical protein
MTNEVRMIPKNYQEWHKCITVDCNILLTPDYIKKRLSIYKDENHLETIKFKSLYGQVHLQNIVKWLHEV